MRCQRPTLKAGFSLETIINSFRGELRAPRAEQLRKARVHPAVKSGSSLNLDVSPLDSELVVSTYQRARKILSECWLTVSEQDSVLENLHQVRCRPTDPYEPLANDLGIVRLPGGQVERRAAGVEPAVPPDGVRDGFGLDFAF